MILENHKLDYEQGRPNRINEELFKRVRLALKLKKANQKYTTFEEIRLKFGIGHSSFLAIQKSRTIAEYRNNRKRLSRPEKYKEKN